MDFKINDNPSATMATAFSAETDLPDDACQLMSDFMVSHHLSVANPDAVRFRHSGIQMTEVNVSQIQYGTKVTIDLAPMQEHYSISLPISGYQTLTTGDRVVHSTPNQGLILCAHQPGQLLMSADCRKRLVRISTAALERQLQRLLNCELEEPVLFEPSVDVNSGRMSSWWRMVKNLENEQKQPESLFAEGPVLSSIEDMLITGLLFGQPHNYSQDLEQITTVTVPVPVQRACRFIHRHAQDPIRFEEIIAAAGVPKRTLYDAFKRCYGVPPMRYLREVRLRGVHGELQKGPNADDITTIALRWGFTHLGRFTADYKQRFGELPSKTRADALSIADD